MTKYLHVYGHPRSGNNLLMAFLAKNFYPGEDLSTGLGRVGHYAKRVRGQANPHGRLGGTHHIYGDPNNRLWRPIIYIYRDGRSVCRSLFMTKEFLNPAWVDMPFSEFLREPLDWTGSPGNNAPYNRSIVHHWKAHLDSWKRAPGVLKVRYESIVNRPGKTLRGIAAYYGLPLPPTTEQIDEPVGWFPHDGRVGSWRDIFSDSDLEYFYSIVPKSYWGLWGKR